MIFCACAMQNSPGRSEKPQDHFHLGSKLFAQTQFGGLRRAVVTSPPYTKTKSKAEFLSFDGRRIEIRSSFFVWLVLFLNAGAMGAFAVAVFFWSSVPNPATRKQELG
jgi:hypothetical protein